MSDVRFLMFDKRKPYFAKNLNRKLLHLASSTLPFDDLKNHFSLLAFKAKNSTFAQIF